MLVMFHCFDNKNQQKTRMDNLQAHLSWVEENMNSIKVAGPLLQESTNDILGSLYILEATNLYTARQLLEHDPYYKADIWQRITTTEFKDYAGTWVGGKNWPNA